MLAHTAIETGFLSAVEAHSVQEQARERIGRRECERGGEKKRHREEKEKQREGRSERERERVRGKVRETVTGEYIAVTAD